MLIPDSTVTSNRSIPDALKTYVTQWGSDPIWAPQRNFSPLIPDDFSPTATAMGGLTLDEVDHSLKVCAIGLPVEYDADRKLWFCDVELANTSAYTPFIRFAIARFQPNSIPHAHLSRVVLTDFMQVLPDRTARVEFPDSTDAKKLQVTVSGVYGANDLTSRLAVPAGGDPSPVPNLDASRVVQVEVEVADPTVEGDLKWLKIGAPTTLSQLQFAPSSGKTVLLWRGNVVLPDVPKSKNGSQSFRILIQEFERLETDEDVKEFTLTRFGQSSPMRSRVVYADAIEI